MTRLSACFPRPTLTRAHFACTLRGVVAGHAGLLSIVAKHIRQDIGRYTECRAACTRSNGSRSCSLAAGTIDLATGHVFCMFSELAGESYVLLRRGVCFWNPPYSHMLFSIKYMQISCIMPRFSLRLRWHNAALLNAQRVLA